MILTHANQTVPLISAGGGLKFRVAKHAQVRIDFRDYMTPLPDQLLAVLPSGSTPAGPMTSSCSSECEYTVLISETKGPIVGKSRLLTLTVLGCSLRSPLSVKPASNSVRIYTEPAGILFR